MADGGRQAVVLTSLQQRDGRLSFSPTDLAAFVACPHLNWLQVRVARGDLPKPFRHNPHADLIRAKGEEHERAFFASLDGEVTSIDTEQPFERGGAAGFERLIRPDRRALLASLPSMLLKMISFQ